MNSEENLETTLSCLRDAIEDTQLTIRAYDMKANSLGVLLTVALGITNFTLLQSGDDGTKGILIACWVAGLLAITFCGLVLHPRKNPFDGLHLGGYTPKGTYFLRDIKSSPENTVVALAEKALATDWLLELTYENMKLSTIRDYKHGAFIAALGFSMVTLLLIGFSVVQR